MALRLRLRLSRRVCVVVGGCLVLAYAGIVGRYTGLGPGFAYDIAWSFSALAATLACFAAYRSAAPGNRRRWALWTAACTSWFVAQLIWDLYGLIGFAGDPNPADLGWWAFAFLVTASVLPDHRRGRSHLAVAAVESVPLMCAAVGLCLALLWRTATHSPVAPSARVSDLVYPCVYAAATILTLQAMLGGTLRGFRLWPSGLFLAGTAVISAAFILWSGELLNRTYVSGTSILDPLWVIGLSLISLGAITAAGAPEPAAPSQSSNQLGVILPAGMLALLAGVLLTETLAGAPRPVKEILLLGVLCSGTALIVRSNLISRQIRGLLDREQAAFRVLAEREVELGRLNAQLVQDSRHDPLTGIGNRRALADDLPKYLTRQREAAEPIAVLVCDVDHFKAYNDSFGHLAGDRALTTLTAIVRGVLRADDAAYRFGGEELIIILRGALHDQAREVAERIRVAIAHAGIHHPLTEAGVLTVSIGIACGLDPPETLIARADAALYQAKEQGRDRVADAAGPVPLDSGGRGRVPEEPAARHLRSMLAVSRAAAGGQGEDAVIEALAEAIRIELSFSVVVVNLRDAEQDGFRVVTVSGDSAARAELLGTRVSEKEWADMHAAAIDVHGALWLPAGSYDHDRGSSYWRPQAVGSLAVEGWHPDDMLLLPLRSQANDVLGFVSVDQPLFGHRPGEAQIAVMMAVVDHAALALEQMQGGGGRPGSESDGIRLAAVMLLAETLDLRHPSTGSHARTVGALAGATAAVMGLDRTGVDRVRAAGVLHDLGKLGIPDAILYKPGSLDAAEWVEIRRHPEIGARILEHAGLTDIAEWVRDHHERMDGAGYPRGLPPERIPLPARILAVADAFEAMVADRPYRRGMPLDMARAELRECAGSQFDPVVVDAFLTALDGSVSAENGNLAQLAISGLTQRPEG